MPKLKLAICQGRYGAHDFYNGVCRRCPEFEHPSPCVVKPQPYGHYEGCELPADMQIWSIGRTPTEAVAAFIFARCGTHLDGPIEVMTGGDPRYTWGCRFTSNGTGFKAAGVHVHGGVILTWWK